MTENVEEKTTSVENKTNGWAIAGLILSIVASGLLGIIFSIIGLNKSKELNSGKGLSIAGIIIGVLKLIFTIIIIIITLTATANIIDNSKEATNEINDLYSDVYE